MVRVEIDSIRVSLMSQERVVVLKDAESDRYLPIWIGAFEAEAIRVELQDVTTTRPLTHDLLKSVITELGGKVERIVVSELRNEIFYATIMIHTGDGTLEIDARPSDAIALAVRLKAPIFVAESVMSGAAIEPEDEVAADPTVKPDIKAEKAVEDVNDDEDLSVFEDFLESLGLDDEDSEE